MGCVCEHHIEKAYFGVQSTVPDMYNAQSHARKQWNMPERDDHFQQVWFHFSERLVQTW